MRSALRSATALALAVPLIASALPASASSSLLYRERGTLADTSFEGPRTPGGLPGNYSYGWLTFHSSDLAEGYVETFECDENEVPWGDENGENACEPMGSYYAWGEELTVISGKGKGAATTFSGVVDIFDATTEEGALAAADVPFSVTLTPTGATWKSTYSDSYRDPATGTTYRFREMRSTSSASVQGDFDGLPGIDGSVGTYSLRSMERIA